MRPASRHSPYITSKIITGVRRSANYLISLALGDRAQARQLRARQRSLPSSDPNDPGYRRLRYVRYVDLCRALIWGDLGPVR